MGFLELTGQHYVNNNSTSGWLGIRKFILGVLIQKIYVVYH